MLTWLRNLPPLTRMAALTILAASLGLTIGRTGDAQQPPTITWSWTAPAFGPGLGMPADAYRLEALTVTAAGDSTREQLEVGRATSWTMPWPPAVAGELRVRVQGIDIYDRPGAWSSWSAAGLAVDNGAPGAPSRPTLQVVVP